MLATKQNLTDFVRHLLGLKATDKQIQKYKQNEYLEVYAKHTDLLVQANPQAAMGGEWEEIGQLQFEFLVKQGLRPYHKMLDIGCGTLRGGRHFIRYLDSNNYCGLDISQEAIAYARQLVRELGLLEQKPRLIVNQNKALKFDDFSGESFDFILAQSVFTYLKPRHISECFRNLNSIMSDRSVFYFTFNNRAEFKHTGIKGFSYSYSYFKTLATQYGFKLRDCSSDYDRQRGQRMAELKIEQIL